MLSDDNLEALERDEFPFIVAARIRNETKAMQEEILTRCVGLANGQSVEIRKPGGHRLIVTYSDKRARKDVYNRDRGVKRLQKRIRSGKLTKENLNNRGYNKFLRLHGEISVEIDKKKIADSAKGDGLKGYLFAIGQEISVNIVACRKRLQSLFGFMSNISLPVSMVVLMCWTTLRWLAAFAISTKGQI